MEIAITSMQKNRGKYILEWLAFHMVVGVSRFYIYCHNTTDDMTDTLNKLSQHYPIFVKSIDSQVPMQLQVFQESADHNMTDVDWMAFLDGDEFLLPVQHETLNEAIAAIPTGDASGIGVYWMCYGSSGHLEEPSGLVLENFTRHSENSFGPNRHIKSILKGRAQLGYKIISPHFFDTEFGMIDELGRVIDPKAANLPPGLSEHSPSVGLLRINHYVTQSYNYYRYEKKGSGAADSDLNAIRDTQWFFGHDRNECDDQIRYKFLLKIKIKLEELQSKL